MTELVERALQGVPPAVLGTTGPFRFLFRCGGDGPTDTTQAIIWGRGVQPVAVAKIARGERGRQALQAEGERLERVSALMTPRWRHSVPRRLGFFDDGAHAVLTESHVPGRRIKDLPRSVLARRPDSVTEVVDWLVDFTLAAGVRRADGVRLRRCLDEPIARYREAFATDPAEENLLAQLADRVRGTLGAAVPLVAAHGDLCDANVLLDGDRIGVVDWEEPIDEALPGADLFYFLCSLVAGTHSLGGPRRFAAAFAEGFFSATPTAGLFRQAWTRYRQALDLPEAAGLPLFAAAWVGFAGRKLRYLQESAGAPAGRGPLFEDPQRHYPVIFFADGRCLNVSLTARHARSFAL